jgi:hypothetical protein
VILDETRWPVCAEFIKIRARRGQDRAAPAT